MCRHAGKDVGWLSNTRPASNIEYAGWTSPRLLWVLRVQGCAPDQEEALPEQHARPTMTAVGHAMGADWVAWATPGWRVTWLGTCPRVGHVVWHTGRVL